jgi:hypothetical protein
MSGCESQQISVNSNSAAAAITCPDLATYYLSVTIIPYLQTPEIRIFFSASPLETACDKLEACPGQRRREQQNETI